VNEHQQAELLERLLAGDGDALAAARGDAQAARELERLESFLDGAREHLRDTSEWSAVREGALVGRVLARTTREDLSWRGELRLLGGFLRDRLSASPALRLLAACVLLQLVAAPFVLAYVWKQSKHDFTLGLEPPREESPFAEEQEEEPADLAPDRYGPTEAEIENALRRERYVLATARGPVLADEGEAGLELRVLAARTRFLAEREWTPWLDERERRREGSPLARILWAEVLLDRLALEGVRSPLLGTGLNDVALLGEELADDERELAERCLDRARACGAWELEAGFRPLEVEPPLAASWFDALERAAAGTELAESVVRLRDWSR